MCVDAQGIWTDQEKYVQPSESLSHQQLASYIRACSRRQSFLSGFFIGFGEKILSKKTEKRKKTNQCTPSFYTDTVVVQYCARSNMSECPECLGRDGACNGSLLLELPSPLGAAFVSLACSRCGECVSLCSQSFFQNIFARNDALLVIAHVDLKKKKKNARARILNTLFPPIAAHRCALRCVCRSVRRVRWARCAALALLRRRIHRKPRVHAASLADSEKGKIWRCGQLR